MSKYFSESKSLGGRGKFELNLSNYATKPDIKTASGIDTSKFAKKVDLAKIKSIEDKIADDSEKSNITNINSTTALTAVENKIPNVSNLVKKHWLQQKN